VHTAHSAYSVYREVVAQLMSGNEQLPSLPSITLEIRRALEQPDISFLSLSKIIAKDPSLSALLLKYASSAEVHAHTAPQNLLEVVRLLGMGQVEHITMVHSVQSLFTIHSVQHKRLFVQAWNRVVLKASVSIFIARTLGRPPVDHALLGSLLSEIGTLAVLSAFKLQDQSPEVEVYVALCREYSKSLGVIMLKKWQVDEEYIRVIRNTGIWHADADEPFSLSDVINLGLYHSLKLRQVGKNLPPLQELGAYKKLSTPHNLLSKSGNLELVTNHVADIRELARALFKVNPH
jgi:HD-like signal output (HDOD) protein